MDEAEKVEIAEQLKRNLEVLRAWTEQHTVQPDPPPQRKPAVPKGWRVITGGARA